MTAPSRSAVRHASTKLLPEPTSAAISFALWDIHLVTFFVGTWTLLGALGVSLRLRTSPDLLVENTERQTQRRDGESGVLDGEHKLTAIAAPKDLAKQRALATLAVALVPTL